MWYSFAPTAGRRAGGTYYFPTTADDVRANRRTSTLQAVAYMDGDYDSSGTSPMPLVSGEVTVTFDLYPQWLLHNLNRNYYNGTLDDVVARENAILDFIVSVVEGGQGTIVDSYSQHSGIIDPVSGAAITSYSATGKVSGDCTVTRMAGTGRATIAVVMSIQSGVWTANTGQTFGFS